MNCGAAPKEGTAAAVNVNYIPSRENYDASASKCTQDGNIQYPPHTLIMRQLLMIDSISLITSKNPRVIFRDT